jgi:linoleoyl-CoA desaturase
MQNSALQQPVSRFADADHAFSEALRRRVLEHLRAHPSGRFAGALTWLKVALLLASYLGVWAALSFARLTPAEGAGLALLLGFLGTCIALNVGHEAAHSVFSRREWVNALLYCAGFDLLGFSGYLWKLGHNRTHHQAANVPGRDVGCDGGPLLRLAAHTPWRPYHRYQHLYAPFLYSIYTLAWVLFRDWKVLLSGAPIAGVRVRHSPWRVAELAAIKAFYFAYAVGIPLAYSSFTPVQVLAGFVLMHMALSLYIAAMLFTSHLAEEPAFPVPDAQGRLPHSFARHQLLTTQDYHPESRLAAFFLGGFNAHAIHHLFPRVSSEHYPRLSAILARTCREHGIPYLTTTIRQGVASHLRYLRKMGER